jgi:hypothetical protein
MVASRLARRSLWALPLVRASRPVFTRGNENCNASTNVRAVGGRQPLQYYCDSSFVVVIVSEDVWWGWFIRGFVTGLLRFTHAVVFVRVSSVGPPHTIRAYA